MGQLVDTEEILTALSVQLRMGAYSAIEASNHLAVHSSRTYSIVLHDMAMRLSELAMVARDIGEAHAT